MSWLSNAFNPKTLGIIGQAGNAMMKSQRSMGYRNADNSPRGGVSGFYSQVFNPVSRPQYYQQSQGQGQSVQRGSQQYYHYRPSQNEMYQMYSNPEQYYQKYLENFILQRVAPYLQSTSNPTEYEMNYQGGVGTRRKKKISQEIENQGSLAPWSMGIG